MSNSTMIDWTQDPEWIMSKINSEQVISSAWLKGVIENPPSPECKAAAEERLRIIHKPIARS